MLASLFTNIKVTVCNKLKGLDPGLSYHNLLHTLDVLHQSEKIAIREGITTEEELFILKVAALYHDTGFLRTYLEHEKMSCAIFLEDADKFGFEEKQKAAIQSLIMATRIPQTPGTLAERVICDADLDYLGREDFFETGDSLRKELLHYHILPSNAAWHQLQKNFLKTHQYHTASSRLHRDTLKEQHYQSILST